MDYKQTKYCNPNVQTLPLLNKADLVECFSKWCTKEGSPQSSILKYFRYLRLWNFQWEIVIMKISGLYFQQGRNYSDKIEIHQE